uniref:Uncharacterized protein n=1 Tax=Monopterus albus TaxID=43700 RepID=A0A3Q3IN99_MONAL
MQQYEKNSQLNMRKQEEDIQIDGSGNDPNRPQGQEEPEERDVISSKERGAPLPEVYTKILENETSEKALADWEKDYLWYIWNMFSVISMIGFFRKYLGKKSQMKQDKVRAFPVITGKVQLPDSDTLQSFHSKGGKWREDEFLEGFANDLLEIVGTCDITVHFNPPEPYTFQCLLWNNQASDLLPDMQLCGQIKVAESKIQNGCHCQSSDADMVCLLHCDNEKIKTKMTISDGLCVKNTFLSTSQVTRWFQTTIKQAWAPISHKYEFELNIRYIDAPGICFNMNPVVKYNTDTHFYIAPCCPKNLDTLWTLSLTSYEDHLLEHLAKSLPENSCHIQTLEIACFLHKRQTSLSGSSALKDFHFKTWKHNCVASRLQDLLDFMKGSLEKKLLHHVLIGNPLKQVIQLPTKFAQAKPLNLFHPLVVHKCIYRNAVMHFQEMLRNADMLIHDYYSDPLLKYKQQHHSVKIPCYK